jgi:hypothetical protein
MKSMISGSVCLAAVCAFGAVAFGQEPRPPATQSQTRAASDQQITVTGCVERETDYRKAHDAGRGGVAGTGVGAGNEYILTNAALSPNTTTARTPESERTSPTGTAGSSAMAYELTGPNEGQVGQYVGRRVEISGKLKAAETTPSGQPTGGATAGPPPSGVDVASKDLKLRELDVTSVRETTGTCPSGK